jgi:hypothetical protein
MIKNGVHITDIQYFRVYLPQYSLMHNIKTNFDIISDICNDLLKDYLIENGNFYVYRNKPKMADIQIVALALTAEALSIDSENLLFVKLNKEYKADFPNLIDRANFNKRRRRLAYFISLVSQLSTKAIEPSMESFIIDSMPISICKNIRIIRNKFGTDDDEIKPTRGYHACSKNYFFGFKLQLIISKPGIPHSAFLTTASMHDSAFLECFESVQISDCELLGDMGYLSKNHQLSLFENYNIKMITPFRSNMNQIKCEWNPKTRYERKRIETIFSQLDDHMLIKRNYAKSLSGLLVRVCTKVSAIAVLQYVNKKNNKPLNKIKHALAA